MDEPVIHRDEKWHEADRQIRNYKKKKDWWWLKTGQTSNTCKNKVKSQIKGRFQCKPILWMNEQFFGQNDPYCEKRNCPLKREEKDNET
jgi:hypothetical protein